MGRTILDVGCTILWAQGTHPNERKEKGVEFQHPSLLLPDRDVVWPAAAHSGIHTIPVITDSPKSQNNPFLPYTASVRYLVTAARTTANTARVYLTQGSIRLNSEPLILLTSCWKGDLPARRSM